MPTDRFLKRHHQSVFSFSGWSIYKGSTRLISIDKTSTDWMVYLAETKAIELTYRKLVDYASRLSVGSAVSQEKRMIYRLIVLFGALDMSGDRRGQVTQFGGISSHIDIDTFDAEEHDADVSACSHKSIANDEESGL